MSITSTSNTVTYDGDGTTVNFPYAFPLQNASDMQVWVTDASGNITQLTSNFQVDTANARVIYPTTGTALANDGSKITLLRVVPLTQTVSLSNTGPLPALTLEAAYDKLTMALQQYTEQLSRTLQFPVGTAVDPTDTTELLAEILAGSANAAAAQAAAASITFPIPISNGGTASTTALANGKIMASSSNKIVESGIGISSAKLTGLDAGTTNGDSVRFEQLKDVIQTAMIFGS